MLILPGWYEPTDSLAEYLSYSLAEEMISRLSGFSDLRIIAAPSAGTLTYARGGPAAAARKIGVKNYVHWSVRTTPASVFFDLTLRDTTLVDPVWTTKKESSLRELPAAISEIAAAIAERMELTSAGQGGGSVGPVTTDPDAYLQYLRGQFMLGHLSGFSPGNATDALTLAVEADPGFADARIALAWSRLMEFEETGDTSLPRSAWAALNAFPTPDGNPRYLMTRGLLEQKRSEYDKAQEFLTRVVAQAPGNAEAHRRLAHLLLCRGNPGDALVNAGRAIRLDPLNVSSYTMAGLVEIYNGDFEAALEVFRQGAGLAVDSKEYTVRYFPELYVLVQRHNDAEAILSDEVAGGRDNQIGYYRLGRVYQAAGKAIDRWRGVFQRAADITKQKLQSSPRDAVGRSFLALVLTRLGKHEDAVREIDRALKTDNQDARVLYNIAKAFAMQKKNDQALDYLQKAIEVRYDIESILDMDFYNLRTDERFASVVAR
jgi:tetratricopeptide (TPR) repeat protein